MVDLNGVNKANAFTCTCQHITSSSLASSVSFPHFFSFSFTCNYLREFLFFDIAYSHGSCVQCSCCQYNSVIGEAFSVAVALVKVIIVCVAPMKCWVLAIRKWNEWNDEEEESICMHMSFFSSDLELLREFIKYWHARSCDDSWSWDVKPKRIHLDCDFIQTHNRSNPSGFSAVRTNSFLSRRRHWIRKRRHGLALCEIHQDFERCFLSVLARSCIWMNGIGRRSCEKRRVNGAALTLNLIMVINCGPFSFVPHQNRKKRRREKGFHVILQYLKFSYAHHSTNRQ